jgi:hypothetical protein
MSAFGGKADITRQFCAQEGGIDNQREIWASSRQAGPVGGDRFFLVLMRGYCGIHGLLRGRDDNSVVRRKNLRIYSTCVDYDVGIGLWTTKCIGVFTLCLSSF